MWIGPLVIASVIVWACLGWWAFGKTVRHDMGGVISERIAEMQGMDGVRIVGKCYSACTLYLGLPHTCVTPSARLGFHSPFMRVAGLDVPMQPDQWEATTRFMAAHYPTGIAEWWMRDARHRTNPVILTGRQAIEMGARPC
jgi:hypothetical protein